MKWLMTSGVVLVLLGLVHTLWHPEKRDDRDAKDGIMLMLAFVFVVLACIGIWTEDWT